MGRYNSVGTAARTVWIAPGRYSSKYAPFPLTLDVALGCRLTFVNGTVLQIGEIAARAGVSVDTVRYYEKRRLLPRAPRTEGGFRVFGPEAVERVQFIRQAQDIGLSLEQIAQLLATGGADECLRMRDLLRVKLGEIDERMVLMRKFRRTLVRHLSSCEKELQAQGEAASCPVVVEISHTRNAPKAPRVRERNK